MDSGQPDNIQRAAPECNRQPGFGAKRALGFTFLDVLELLLRQILKE